jgi:hypothetical protein
VARSPTLLCKTPAETQTLRVTLTLSGSSMSYEEKIDKLMGGGLPGVSYFAATCTKI